MLTAVAWKWNRPDGTALFGPEYVNRLRAGLAKHLQLEHELVCITDDARGIDPRVRIVPMPTRFADTPRCRRRLQRFSRAFGESLGSRLLCLDLDLVLVDDITPLVDRPEPLVCWKVGYAGAYAGAFLLQTPGVLDGLWQAFSKHPVQFWRQMQPHGTPSDQAALNWWLKGKPVPHWTERDGFVTWFGRGYERYEHLGVGPGRQVLPDTARVVVLGSADKALLDEGQTEWAREHWLELEGCA